MSKHTHNTCTTLLFAVWMIVVYTVNCWAGIEATPDFSSSLITDVFLDQGCFEVSNIQLRGDSENIGFFEYGRNSISINKGIILATGDVSYANGPNNSGGNLDYSGNGGDAEQEADLQKLADAIETFDVTAIEFDFVPSVDEISFRYVFASEEYCDFVGSKFNDVFGFFISGPGIQDSFVNNARNIALIPDSEDFVAINNVNHITNSEYYISNTDYPENETSLGTGCFENGLVPPAVALSEIQHDGFTTVLTAKAEVIPCETYHIKIAIADIVDDNMDSAVFLEENSFKAGDGIALGTLVANVNSNNAIEGCQEVYFVFERIDKNFSEDLVVNFRLSENSTAIEGEDFDTLARTVIIPAGEGKVELPVNLYDDNIDEEREEIIIEYDLVCGCGIVKTVSTNLYVSDALPLVVTMADSTSVCSVDSVLLSPDLVEGGVPPYQYNWNNGRTDKEIYVQPSEDSTFDLKVTDACGDSLRQDIFVSVIPNATFTVDTTICSGRTVIFEGVNVAAGEAEEFRLAGNNGCDSIVTIRVSERPISILTQERAAGCNSENDGQIAVQVVNGAPPYSYSLNQGGFQNDSIFNNLLAGEYVVYVKDATDCIVNDSVMVRSTSEFTVELTETPIIAPFEPTTLSVLATSNVINTYLWQPSETLSCSDCPSPVATPLNTTIYTLTATNGAGCMTTAEVTLTVFDNAEARLLLPPAFSPNGDGVNDDLKVLYTGELSQFKVVIYNRWGKQVYYSESERESWDGTLPNGQAADIGVYFYYIEGIFKGSETQKKQGTITLIR